MLLLWLEFAIFLRPEEVTDMARSVNAEVIAQKQQIVRSLAETVANPRTSSQMFGRMVMSSVMQAVSAFKPIIDHSFDGFSKGQPSISEFIRRNYALVKADAMANPATGNKFGLVKYQEKGVKAGAFIVSNGTVVAPTAVTADNTGLMIALTAQTLTVGGLKTALGLSADGYITYVAIGDDGVAYYVRVQLSTTLADDTAITADNVASLFKTEGNLPVDISLGSNNIFVAGQQDATLKCSGKIVSEKINGAWAHSTCVLSTPTTPSYTSDVALPTYPTGSEQFLNGGDI